MPAPLPGAGTPVRSRGGRCRHLRLPRAHRGPFRDLGVQVLARLRPWLAPLLALTANSPIADGHDTGWASWRYPIQARWPTAVPPAAWPDAAAYDTAVRRLIGRGAALDERSVYFLARLSPRYPTVEVRVADVCPTPAGTAVLLAGLTRALVATALSEARRGTPTAVAPARQVAAALTAAARQGRAGGGVDPFTGQAVDAPTLRARLLDHVHPALADHGAEQPRRSPGCCIGSTSGGPEPTGSEPCSPALHPGPRSSRHSSARRCPGDEPTPPAPARCPGPGSCAIAHELAGDGPRTGGDAASGVRGQMTWPLRAARLLTDLRDPRGPRGPARAGVDDQPNGAQVTGRSYAQPGQPRRAALAAWAAASAPPWARKGRRPPGPGPRR